MNTNESHTSRADLMAARVVGPGAYLLLLSRVPLIAAIVLIATLSDWAIPGSMREAMRFSVIDAPWQLPAMAVGVLLVCAGLRYTSEAMIELVAPDLFQGHGNVGRAAHLLPRALALGVAIACALPLIVLACDSSGEVLKSSEGIARNHLLAGGTGALFIVIGLCIALTTRVKVSSSDTTGQAGLPLRVALAALPVAFSVAILGALFGIWRPDSGMAAHALSRYQTLGWSRIALEALGLYFCCVSTRLCAAVVVELLAPKAEGGMVTRALRSNLSRFAAGGVGVALALQFLADTVHSTAGSSRWVLGVVALYVAIGLLAGFSEISWSAIRQSSDAFVRTGRRWRAAADRLSMLTMGWGAALTILYAVALAVTLVFIYAFSVSAAQIIGPIAIILLWGFCAAFLFFPIAFAAHLTRMPLLLILIATGVAFAGFDLNDNHEISQAPPSAAQAGEQTAYRENIDLGQWLASRADWKAYPHYPIFLVATEGGGIRAAYFTATVLAALQDRCPAFAQHTLAISGVSGGSVGAAVFAALTADRAQNATDAPCNLQGDGKPDLTKRARTVLSADLLSPLIEKMLFPDSLQRILPVPIDDFDRARGIELALDQAWSDANVDCARCAPRMAESVGALYSWPRGASRPPVPHLFLNTTEVKSGRIRPFATGQVVDLATSFVMDARAEIDQPGTAALRQVALQDLMAENEKSASLSAAAMLSARFPYLAPAGLLTESGHYVDGGYFENSGTSTLGGVLQNLIGQKTTYSNPGNPALEAAVKNVVFVTIIIHSEPCTTTCDVVDTGAAGQDTTWNEVLSPIRALLNTRDQRAEYSITDLDALTALVEQFALTPSTPADDGTRCDELVCSVTLRFGSAPRTEIPLTWLLSRPARKAMDEAVDSMLSADVRQGLPAAAVIPITSDQPSTNEVLGSYSRVLCLLAARNGAAGCK